jgi:hypothetical protein
MPAFIKQLLLNKKNVNGMRNKYDLIVCVDVDRLDKGGVSHVRNEVENFLKHVCDLVVHRQLPVNHLKKRNKF